MAAVEIFVLVLSSVLCLFFLLKLAAFLQRVWWNPMQLQAFLASQGIRGPSYSFPNGSTKEISKMVRQSMEASSSEITHDVFRRTQPYLYTWIKTYGKTFSKLSGNVSSLSGLPNMFLVDRDEFFILAWFECPVVHFGS